MESVAHCYSTGEETVLMGLPNYQWNMKGIWSTVLVKLWVIAVKVWNDGTKEFKLSKSDGWSLCSGELHSFSR